MRIFNRQFDTIVYIRYARDIQHSVLLGMPYYARKYDSM